jgi:hypothetical protein
LYVDSTYARAPKFGFIYFVQINLNSDAIIDQQWLSQRGSKDVGLLAKKTDLPRFTVATETVNQYNRKTVVQTKLTYSPITIELHDDNSNLTHNLWLNYFKHYYADSNYGDLDSGTVKARTSPEAFRDTKYGTIDYTYGRYDRGLKDNQFIKSIDIYVLHQKKFTQYTLINPLITEWAHDNVAQSDGGKILQNKMQVSYETVIYKTGAVNPGKSPETWIPIYYDNTPSPYGVKGDPFPEKKIVYRPPANSNPLLDIAKILAKNYINKNGLGKAKGVGYNIASSALGAISATSPGKYSSPPSTQNQPGIFNLPGGIGINIFKGFNTSVDGKIRANPAAIIFPPKR